MSRIINFDMDGTIADFYGVDNWLNYLRKEKTKPYREARPLVDMRELAKEIKRLQAIGYEVNIISWLSRDSSEEYEEKVNKTKRAWLKKHLGSVNFDNIYIVSYGVPKTLFSEGILFDDDYSNRKIWNREGLNLAFDEKNILLILKGLE